MKKAGVYDATKLGVCSFTRIKTFHKWMRATFLDSFDLH